MKALFALAWTYLWSRPLVAALNLLLLTLGLGAFTFVLLVDDQVGQRLGRDAAGIDLVVGAKGSPLQLMLAGVYHLDVPTGNIPLAAAQRLAAHPQVAEVIPLSLGDNLLGHRIVGTTPAYAAHYGAVLAAGRGWQVGGDGDHLEAVLGAEAARATGLAVGDRATGSHGLGSGGEEHAQRPYEIVGILAPTGSVIDRLVLTDTASVWAVHEHPVRPHIDTLAEAGAGADADAAREVTLLLLRYRSPLAAVSLPAWVNAQPGLQAASPALETARLLRMVGVGVDVLRGFGWVLLAASALSVFVGLVHAVRERAADLALMRLLGAPPRRVAGVVAAEGLWLASLGSAAGLLLGHGLVAVLGQALAQRQSLAVSAWHAVPGEALVPLLAVALALAACAWPVWQAYRSDAAALLQGG
jgi:putative ABC transport system permease protein